MFLFTIIFFVVNLLATCGYYDILPLRGDRQLHTYWILTTVSAFILFFTVPSIMKELFIGVILYEVVGICLYLRQCVQYNREQEIERENW